MVEVRAKREAEGTVCVARWDRKGAIIGGSRMIARSRACDKHGEGKRIADKYDLHAYKF